MRWATKSNLGNQGPAAAWLILRFIDPDAELLFFPKETALADAIAAGAKTFYVPGGDFHKSEDRTTFDALLAAHELAGKDAALDQMAEVFRDISLRIKRGLTPIHPEAHGIRALMAGFAQTTPEPQARLTQLLSLYDALYQWCVKTTTPPNQA